MLFLILLRRNLKTRQILLINRGVVLCSTSLLSILIRTCLVFSFGIFLFTTNVKECLWTPYPCYGGVFSSFEGVKIVHIINVKQQKKIFKMKIYSKKFWRKLAIKEYVAIIRAIQHLLHNGYGLYLISCVMAYSFSRADLQFRRKNQWENEIACSKRRLHCNLFIKLPFIDEMYQAIKFQ